MEKAIKSVWKNKDYKDSKYKKQVRITERTHELLISNKGRKSIAGLLDEIITKHFNEE